MYSLHSLSMCIILSSSSSSSPSSSSSRCHWWSSTFSSPCTSTSTCACTFLFSSPCLSILLLSFAFSSCSSSSSSAHPIIGCLASRHKCIWVGRHAIWLCKVLLLVVARKWAQFAWKSRLVYPTCLAFLSSVAVYGWWEWDASAVSHHRLLMMSTWATFHSSWSIHLNARKNTEEETVHLVEEITPMHPRWWWCTQKYTVK